MASFEENIQKVKTARYGEEVRGAISEGLQQAHNINYNLGGNSLYAPISTTDPGSGGSWSDYTGIELDTVNNTIKNLGIWYIWDSNIDGTSGYIRANKDEEPRTPSCGKVNFPGGKAHFLCVDRNTGLVDIIDTPIDSAEKGYIIVAAIYQQAFYGFNGDESSFYIKRLFQATDGSICETNRPIAHYIKVHNKKTKETIRTERLDAIVYKATIGDDGNLIYGDDVSSDYYITKPFSVNPGDIIRFSYDMVPFESYHHYAIYSSNGVPIKFGDVSNFEESSVEVPNGASYCITSDSKYSNAEVQRIVSVVSDNSNKFQDSRKGYELVRIRPNWNKALGSDGNIQSMGTSGEWVISQKIPVHEGQTLIIHNINSLMQSYYIGWGIYDVHDKLIQSPSNRDNDTIVVAESGAAYLLLMGHAVPKNSEQGLSQVYAILLGTNYDGESIYSRKERDDSISFDEDIALPSKIELMEGHEFDIYYDTLSRYDCDSNLFRISVDGKDTMEVKRNSMCFSWTPGASDSNTTMTVRRSNPNTLKTEETKKISLHVNHKLSSSLTKGILIIGDSITDDNYTAKEVYDLLRADGDITVNMIGKRGPSDGKHEAHSGWTWNSFLQKSSSNPFYDQESDSINIRKYCESNGFADVDYFLANLGTNHISQGENTFNSVESLSSVVDSAKKFLTCLLDETTGFPNCKVALALIPTGAEYFFRAYWSSEVFKMSANTLNHAYLEAFDNGAWKPNVTMMALGSFLNRRYAFPHTESPISSRFSETCITYTDHVHPDARGRRSLADAYYNQIRGWMTEDAS